MKYNRHGRKDRTTKVKNIPNRVSIHDRPFEANGKRFGDWEMDTIIGKNGKGAILTLTERSTNFLIACKLSTARTQTSGQGCCDNIYQKVRILALLQNIS